MAKVVITTDDNKEIEFNPINWRITREAVYPMIAHISSPQYHIDIEASTFTVKDIKG